VALTSAGAETVVLAAPLAFAPGGAGATALWSLPPAAGGALSGAGPLGLADPPAPGMVELLAAPELVSSVGLD